MAARSDPLAEEADRVNPEESVGVQSRKVESVMCHGLATAREAPLSEWHAEGTAPLQTPKIRVIPRPMTSTGTSSRSGLEQIVGGPEL